MMNDIAKIIERIKKDPLDWSALVELARHPNQGVRGTAIQSIAQRFGQDERTVAFLEEMAKEQTNHQRAMGTTTLAQLCVKLLDGIGTDAARKAVASLLSTWPQHDLADLDWFRKHG